ncbi:MAG: hypothetical protein JW801_01180 [Bacteroidales bacterium]|nr:hypothetical protein [Bacteroidales bacterium]
MKLLRSAIFLVILVGATYSAQAQKEIFIKQVEFKLDEVSDIDYENEYFITLKLNKGTKYIFRVTNHIEDPNFYTGEAIVELMEADTRIMTNIFDGQYFKEAVFVCSATGFYDLLVKFRDNKKGNSVVEVIIKQ